MGLTSTTAGRAAISSTPSPFFTLMLLPRFVPSERLRARGVVGTLIAFVGVVLVLSERGTSGGALVGDLLVLLGALAWSANTIMNKTIPRELPTVSVITWNVASAWLVLGERISHAQIAGALAVATGIWVVNSGA